MKRWHQLAIGFVVTVAVVIALGFGARSRVRNFFYPVAPPMPAVVNEPMPAILARLESILKASVPQVLAGLQPGLSAGDIAKLEQQYHVQIPADIQAIYQWHDGTLPSTNYPGNNFIPGHRFVPLEEALEESASISKGEMTLVQRIAFEGLAGQRRSWIYLFSDGAGDGYWFDPQRKPPEGAVFYNFAEVGAYVFFPSAKNLMAGIAKCYEQGIYRVKPGSSPPELDEDFERSMKFWNEFGASN